MLSGCLQYGVFWSMIQSKGGDDVELYIKQRVFSWGDSYDVYDGQGNPKYRVQSELFSFGHQIHVFDARTGVEVGSVHQHILSLFKTFDIVIGGQICGTVQREISLFVPRYTVDYRNWDVEGDFFGWDYTVNSGTGAVMTISKEWLSWGDTYTLRFQNLADEIPGLLLVIAIDAANCDH